jgi:hypothetical protein
LLVRIQPEEQLLLKEFESTEGLGNPINHPLAKLCDQFLQERRYLKNVTLDAGVVSGRVQELPRVC